MGARVDTEGHGILPLSTSVLNRRIEPELQDRLDLDPKLLVEALRAQERIHLFSLTARGIWGPIRQFASQAGRHIRVLDMACGGGELVVDLARYAAKLGLPVSVHGCDINPKSVLFASRKALASGLPVKFFTCDIVNDSIPCGYDVFTSSLFLHHLSEDDALHLLGAIRSASPGLLVVSDLIRCTGGFILAQIACRILTRSYIVHYDGPRSVASAYTIREIDELADRAGLSGHRVDWTWPYRYVLTWKPE